MELFITKSCYLQKDTTGFRPQYQHQNQECHVVEKKNEKLSTFLILNLVTGNMFFKFIIILYR